MNEPVVFFGNEQLATGIGIANPVIYEAVRAAGFAIEKRITGKLSELGSHHSKLAVLVAYGHIIPSSILDQFPLGIINVHPSLLPKYRGSTPIEQAILDGASKTGVSIMCLTNAMDEGPIYTQKTIHLSGQESKVELALTLQQLGAGLIRELLPAIVNGSLKPHRQPHPDRATYTRKLTKADSVVDWDKPAEQIEREIRAFAGWPKSRTILGGKEVIITKAQVVAENGKPGGLSTQNKQIIVHCGRSALLIEYLRPINGKEMTAQAFLAGYKQLL